MSCAVLVRCRHLARKAASELIAPLALLVVRRAPNRPLVGEAASPDPATDVTPASTCDPQNLRVKSRRDAQATAAASPRGVQVQVLEGR